MELLFDSQLESFKEKSLLPLGRFSPSLLPIVGGSTRAPKDRDDLGGGVIGKSLSKRHGEYLPVKIKSAMPKLELDKCRQCRHVSGMTNATLPSGVSDQLEDLRGTIRGCDEALAKYWALEKWEIREFTQVREDAKGRLDQWESNIALANSF